MEKEDSSAPFARLVAPAVINDSGIRHAEQTSVPIRVRLSTTVDNGDYVSQTPRTMKTLTLPPRCGTVITNSCDGVIDVQVADPRRVRQLSRSGPLNLMIFKDDGGGASNAERSTAVCFCDQRSGWRFVSVIVFLSGPPSRTTSINDCAC